MAKSADAFRTISEVAEWLGSPAHVLRFWESKFTQVKPVKRAGGRRYYRPSDMLLIGGIKKLLHDDGMTIKGVQKILREQGVKYVASLSQPLEFVQDDITTGVSEVDKTLAKPASADVVPFQPAEPAAADPSFASAEDVRTAAPSEDLAGEAATEEASSDLRATAADPVETSDGPAQDQEPVDGTPASDTRVLEDFAAPHAEADAPAALEAEPERATAEDDVQEVQAADETPAPEAEVELPAFLHRAAPTPPEATGTEPAENPMAESVENAADETPAEFAESSAEETEPEPEPLRPAQINVPDIPSEEDITAPPGILSRLAARKSRPLDATQLAEAAALRDKLAAMQDGQGNAAGE
ncbi:MerR family transcriptional regulator [Alisedimentitalea sp. MJ-SS2]|uniref:MerR family transcriptional regulator n=1 Tax=Aliisedimentitalea sp. MJ-SS2 TaxID=3049795 RepID=UPI0029061105|nr:MerR family transcriptional regulator [Alisedimentitalea sp. MJ-SS2]MDU8926800.1 MerR family transcriptional regulator [Alisedimentitalea sp. MJ-SS2]